MRSKLVAVIFGGLPIAWTAFDILGYTVNQVTGRSMQPTLNPDTYDPSGRSKFWQMLDWVLIEKTNGDVVRTGDIVTIHNPLVPSDKDIKRVIATENSVVKTKSYKNRIIVVPQGHLWLEGDHRAISKDSNCYGPVPASLVFGKAVWVVFPPWRLQRLKSELPPSNFRRINTSESVLDE